MPLDMSRYLDLFVQEAGDHLEALSRELLALEAGPDPARVDEIFRHAHSLKGMSASMGFEPIAALAHRLEDLMDLVRGGTLALGTEEIDLTLEVTDLLQLLRAEAAKTGAVEAMPEGGDALLVRLDACVAAGKAEAERGDKKPGEPVAPVPPAASTLGKREAPSPLPEGRPLLEVKALIDPASRVPGVRAFLVHKRLSEHGEVVRCSPSLEEMKAGRLDEGWVSIVLATEAGEGTLERALSHIAEIEAVEIRLPRVEESRAEGVGPSRGEGAPGRGSTVRVRTELLDDLMDSAGELLLGVHHLRSLLPDDPQEGPDPVHDAVDRLDKVVREVNRQVVAARMTPMALLFDRLPRTVRDLTRKLGRRVELVLEGSEIELDRAILDEIEAPLMHLVRNAIDHGVEPSEVRTKRGKPEEGILQVTAERDRDRVVISVKDDGGGLDPVRLGEKAVAAGKITPEALQQLQPREVLMLATLPGLSTREAVSEISGRGVGLDVVRDTVEGLGGTLEIDSRPEVGTAFVMRLPLTVAIQRLLLVGSEAQTFAIPVNKVLHVEEVAPEAWSEAHGQAVVPFHDGLVRAFDLRGWLGQREPPDLPRPHVVIEIDSGVAVSVAVDRLKGHLEALIKPLEAPLQQMPGLSGVAFLPEGRPVFVLDLASLARTAEHWTRQGGPSTRGSNA